MSAGGGGASPTLRPQTAPVGKSPKAQESPSASPKPYIKTATVLAAIDTKLVEYKTTIAALQEQLGALEVGSDEHEEMAALVMALEGEMVSLGKQRGRRERRGSITAVQTAAVMMKKKKDKDRKKKKKNKKKKDKSFFDDSYMQKQERDVNIRLLLTKGDELLKKGESGIDIDWSEAVAIFTDALDLDKQCMRGRVGLTKAQKLLDAERARIKQRKKVELMQKRYGENWAEALMMGDPPRTCHRWRVLAK